MQKIWSLVLTLCFVCTGAVTVQAEVVPYPQIKVVRFFAFQGVPEAQVLLGRIYETGDGLEKDIEEAVELYSDAAEQEYADGEYRLASLYERGLGVVQNLDTAAQLYEKACTHGSQAGCDAFKTLTKSR